MLIIMTSIPPVRSIHHSPGGARSHTYARSHTRARTCVLRVYIGERECVYIYLFLCEIPRKVKEVLVNEFADLFETPISFFTSFKPFSASNSVPQLRVVLGDVFHPQIR